MVHETNTFLTETLKEKIKKYRKKRKMRKMRRDIQNKASNLFNRKTHIRKGRINYTESEEK